MSEETAYPQGLPADARTAAVTAQPSPAARPRHRYVLAASLFLATLFSTTTLGAGWYLSTRTDITTDLLPWLSPETIRRVWTEPALLAVGLSFSLPVLLILLCHELGHYFACRWYRLPATLPYFIPAPVALGTLGAFIRIRAVIAAKRELFDVGIAGPLAGFAALVPFLLFGVARSQPALVREVAPAEAQAYLLLPGKCLALEVATRLFHGRLAEGTVLDLHPFALAAWVGLLATALNLMPLGQLDGGHILYAATGRLQRRLALPLWVALGAAGLLWRGWLFWFILVFFMGLRHPPVLNEAEPLDRWRRRLALLALLLLAVSFMPIPIQLVPVEP